MSERESANRMERGSKKYREMIHKDSKRIDDHANLPFTFGKPSKPKPTNTLFTCSNCGHESYVCEETLLVICSSCKHITRMREVEKKGLL